jgi:hydroxyquinol 1,2-dioxygenase
MNAPTEGNFTDAVLARLEKTDNPRLKQILTSLIRHAHAFVRDVELTDEEWMAGIQFLTAVGHMCDDKRQEFILLSDTLGISRLVDTINHSRDDDATPSSLLGPFYVGGAKEMQAGTNIANDTEGDPLFVGGHVVDQQGKPIAGALLDVWQTAPNGLYDVQDPNQPDMNLRGCFRTDANGRFAFRSVRPNSYPIPSDGPVGKMLNATGRHPYRPAHVHFRLSAKGYVPVTTAIYVDGDDYLHSDAVFGQKDSLTVKFSRHDSADEAKKLNAKAPFYTTSFDFALKAA